MRRGVSSQLREDCFLNNLFSSYVYVYFYYQSAHHFWLLFLKGFRGGINVIISDYLQYSTSQALYVAWREKDR